MTEFHVEYRIEVDADNPRAAAEQVAGILANGGAQRGVYHVSEFLGAGRQAWVQEIDLELEAEASQSGTPRICQVCDAVEGTDAYDDHHDSINCWVGIDDKSPFQVVAEFDVTMDAEPVIDRRED